MWGCVVADYDLSRLNSRSFERLVRAVCFKEFGASGTVFSSGPDGGRDFAVDGKISGYEAKGWNGYLVVQAKFRERLLGGASDVGWLIKEIKGELKKYKNNDSLKRPKYYVLASNVYLSGADGGTSVRGRPVKSGYTKIFEELEKWKSEIGVDDFDIWPADKIIDLLANAADIRRTYLAWISSGDVLHAAIKNIEKSTANFDEVMRRSIKNSLRKDQYAGLKDAGDVVDSGIRTSQVFIDLPTKIISDLYLSDSELNFEEDDSNEFWDDGGAPDLHRNNENIVSLVAERAKERFEWEANSNNSRDESHEGPCNKIVVLGGPGQGKSTASLFIAQLFRAAIIKDLPGWKNDPNLRDLVPEIIERAKAEQIATDIPRRYPVFVSLPKFADKISNAKTNGLVAPTLLSQIADDLAVAADQALERSDLRKWLSLYPWIVILDGLDEVPPSGERSAIVDAISAFVSEIADARADVLLIVTTRPQGYNDDLATDEWEHIYLSDLQPERALAYAQSLSFARYQTDPERRDRLQTLLGDAIKKPATSRLMHSPLQVTIMHAIVDTGSSVPSARWTLFNEYFEILRKREKAKGGENQKILERNWSLLGQIHQHAGLILQTNSELSGSAGAVLSRPQFGDMLGALLRSGGYTDTQIAPRVDELSSVALHRLVLLCSREEGMISFDVRSLQEYMAAAALTSGRQIDVEARLSHIAGLAHWRHVFLIAASRCFSEDAFFHLRSIVVAIPRNLETREEQRETKAGARLALEMFSDGIGNDYPVARRQLAIHALEILDAGPAGVSSALLSLLEDLTEDLIFNSVSEAIAEGASNKSVAAWKYLLLLAEKSSRFLRLAEEAWPKDAELILRIVESLDAPLPSQKLIAGLLDAVGRIHPMTARRRLSRFLKMTSGSKEEDYKALRERLGDFGDEYEGRIEVLPDHEGRSPLRLHVVSHNNTQPPFHDVEVDLFHIGWRVISLVAEFTHRPDKSKLAEVLNRLADLDDGLKIARELDIWLPWPVASAVASCKDVSDLRRLASAAAGGDFGDVEDWVAAEERWNRVGIVRADFPLGPVALPMDRHIGGYGLPLLYGYSISHGDPYTMDIVREMVSIEKRIRGGVQDFNLPNATHFTMLGLKTEAIESREDALKLLDVLSQPSVENVYVEVLRAFREDLWRDEEVVEKIASLGVRCFKARGSSGGIPIEYLVGAVNRYPNEKGLLCFIAAGLFGGHDNSSIDFPKITRSALEKKEGDDPLITACSILLSIASGYSTEFDAAVDLILKVPSIGLVRLLSGFFQVSQIPLDDSINVVVRLIHGVQGKRDGRGSVVRDVLKKLLDKKKSGFVRREVWLGMGLPPDAFEIVSAR